jgi:DNA end-binding protein Ku
MWNGSVGFGLVNVPVELVTASRDLDYHFRELHSPDGAPVRHQRYCPAHQAEVERDEIGRGYELDSGEMVVLTDEELESAQPGKSRTVEIESFVELAEIDPIHFDAAYHLMPRDSSKGTLRAYALLAAAMRENGLAAIGRFVMRTREYLVAIRENEGVLSLNTMHFPDEIRPAEEIPGVGELPAPRSAAIKDMIAVIGERFVDWDPESYEDCYRERLKRVIDSKTEGHRIHPPEPADRREGPVPDLMEALKQTLEENRRGKGKVKPRQRRALAELTRDQLYEKARERNLKGRSKMSKDQLAAALSARQPR